MVGMVKNSSVSRDRLASFINSSTDVSSKLESLGQLRHNLLQENDVDSLSGFLPRLFKLQSDEHSPVRKCVAEIIGEIGIKHLEFVPEIANVLMSVLDDSAPAVARQAITCGINLFRSTLQKLAIKGLYTSESDDVLKSSWSSMLEFKEKIYSIAFQPGSGGVRLLALKFVEAVILLYTPDPYGSLVPLTHEGELLEFNITWFRGGHPVLNVGDLSIEASKRLGLLLDQLRFPTVKSLNNLVIIVLINSLATIAKKRPPYYGQILPVLLGLGSSSSGTKVMHASGENHALKNAFLTCLKCTHPGAAPWRDRLIGALREMRAVGVTDEALRPISKINGSTEEEEVSTAAMGEKNITEAFGGHSKFGRKRSGSEDSSELAEDCDVSGKRAKPRPSVSDESTKELNKKITESKDDLPSDGPTVNRRDEDTGPVQQLVAMFGALVAQGEKAVGGLEILISSISADLLAEVVMANMRYLPASPSQAEGGDELLVNITIVGSNTQAKYPSSFLMNVLSLRTSFPQITSRLDNHQSAANDIEQTKQGHEELHGAHMVDSAVVYAGTGQAENEMLPSGLVASASVNSSGMEIDIPSDIQYVGNLESEIPGLDSSAHNNGCTEALGASSYVSTDIEDDSRGQVSSLDGSLNLDFHPALSADKSEELSSKATVTDSSNLISSTAASGGLSCTSVLPKMSATVVNLSEKQNDKLQNLAFIHILEAYKQIAVSGGSQVRFSLLAYLGVEFLSESDPWKFLQEHILSDYVNHEGHELTLRVLYRLYGEVEEERDFFSSTTAATVYENFLLTVAETLRDSFPPSDKSLSRLLGEAPYLPKSILNLLESLCSPGNYDKAEKDFQSGEQVTQGLSTVWSLILLRPPIREVCLKIALKSAVHHLEDVRMKAIRLVANKLYPISSIAQQIEDFAKEKILSIVNSDTAEIIYTEGSVESQKDHNPEKLSNDHQSASSTGKDISSDAPQSCTSNNESSLSMAEAQRYMSLYFALCTKKHSLFREIFAIYNRASKEVKQAVHRHIPILVRTMGSSSELLEIISDPPSGSENLLMQVLQTLTDGIVPSSELLFTIRKLYDSKLKDIEILIPILPFLPRDEVLLIFPHLVNLPLDKFQVALSRVLQGSPHSGPVLTPAEVLIAIHGIDHEKDGIPLKKITDACNACFEQQQIFTQQVIAKVLNQLVEHIPLPLLFMRTVLQAIGAFPALVEFIMEILSRLVSKQIWKYPKLWVGFLKCAHLTKPQSFSVLLQLPPTQLENALSKQAALKAPLVAHASQPNIKSSLPRSVLVVLGIAPEPQTSSQAQTSQAQTEDTSNLQKELLTEKSKESSSAS